MKPQLVENDETAEHIKTLEMSKNTCIAEEKGKHKGCIYFLVTPRLKIVRLKRKQDIKIKIRTIK